MLRDTEMMKLGKEIELFIQYGVVEDMQARGVEVVDRYRLDPVALRLLHEFYRSLPEAREEPVVRVVQIDSRQGVLLLGVLTVSYEYLYLVTETEMIFLGERGQEVEDDVLEFFGYADNAELSKACRSLLKLEEYSSQGCASRVNCPVCSVVEGEFHQLGCPVEVCPWCGGQMNRCNCRFDQLGVERIGSEEEVGRFRQLLVAKGRIRFAREQAPAYPGLGDGPDVGEKLK